MFTAPACSTIKLLARPLESNYLRRDLITSLGNESMIGFTIQPLGLSKRTSNLVRVYLTQRDTTLPQGVLD